MPRTMAPLLFGTALFVAVAALNALPGGAATTLDAAAAQPFPTSSPSAVSFFSSKTYAFSTSSFFTAQSPNGPANLLLLEQGVVIVTDDWAYPHSRHDAGKVDPLTGLPFARNVLEESLTAMTMNAMLRNPHRRGLLMLTSVAFPVLERSIIGSMFRPWKTDHL